MWGIGVIGHMEGAAHPHPHRHVNAPQVFLTPTHPHPHRHVNAARNALANPQTNAMTCRRWGRGPASTAPDPKTPVSVLADKCHRIR